MQKDIQKPKLYLFKCDEKAINLIDEGIDTLRDFGATQDEIKQFETEAISGNYDHLIRVLLDWFDVRIVWGREW